MCTQAIKGFFGLGRTKSPEMQKIDPVATMTNVNDGQSMTGDEAAANRVKKKRGFASTQLQDWRQNTVLGNSNGKNTLG